MKTLKQLNNSDLAKKLKIKFYRVGGRIQYTVRGQISKHIAGTIREASWMLDLEWQYSAERCSLLSVA